MVFVADSRASKLQENIESFSELTYRLKLMGISPNTFPMVLQWNKRDVAESLPVHVLEQSLNLYQATTFEAVATTGHGVVETLRCAVNMTLRCFIDG